MSPKKERLDKLVVARGLVDSRERARALILAGKVLVGDHAANKAGSRVSVDAVIALKEADHPYVSRGGLKLAKALEVFDINPSGNVALDIGSSTGGFTDVLLRAGATQVFAIDVGYNQLAWKLRSDERVVVLERENVRHLDPAKITAVPSLAVIDVSFISLKKILEKVAELLGAEKPIVCLVKPQFEVGKGKVGKGGVVRDDDMRQAVLDDIKQWADSKGFSVLADDVSPIKGPAGNIEFLLHIMSPSDSSQS